jgi:hypothetical protein
MSAAVKKAPQKAGRQPCEPVRETDSKSGPGSKAAVAPVAGAASEPENHSSTEHTQKQLRAMHEGQAFEIRVLGIRGGHVLAGVYDDIDQAVADVHEADAKLRPKGTYVTLNPTTRKVTNKLRETNEATCSADVKRRTHLLIDVDAEKPTGTASSTGQVVDAITLANEIKAHLRDEDWPAPLEVMSGNGAHLIYAVDLNGESEAVGHAVRGISQRFTNETLKVDVKVVDAARITKLAGTMVRKGDPKLWRRAEVRGGPDSLEPVSRDSLASWRLPANENVDDWTPEPEGEFDIEAWVARHLPQAVQKRAGGLYSNRWQLRVCPFNSEHDDRSTWVAQLVGSGAYAAGCAHNSCTWTWQDLREKYEPGCYDRVEASREPWPEPEPYGTELEPVPVLTPDMLPAEAGAWISDIAEGFQLPLSMAAVPALVAMGSLIGNSVAINPDRDRFGWLVYANLYGAIVANSGIGKTPITQAAFAHVRDLEASAREHNENAEREDARELALATEHKKAMERAYKKAADKNAVTQELIIEFNAALDAITSFKPSPRKVYQVNETTPHALHQTIEQSGLPCLLVRRDELSPLMARLQGKGDSDANLMMRQLLLEGYSGDIRFEYRSKGGGVLTVERLCLALYGTIQPGPLCRLVQAEMGLADGLVHRLQMLVWPDVQPWQAREYRQDRGAYERAASLYRRLDALPFTPEDPCEAFFASDAEPVWAKWWNEHKKRCRNANAWSVPGLQEHLAKFDGLAARLALIFELASERASHTSPVIVSSESLRMALKWVTFLEAHARRVFLSAADAPEPMQRFARILQKDWNRYAESGHLSARVLGRGPFKDKGVLDSVLARAVRLSWLRRCPGRGEFYEVNPLIGEVELCA